MQRERESSQAQRVDDQFLRAWPLPMPAPDGDKEERGRAFIIGGSREMPGAILLAANAALHAGAGKLTLAVGQSIASQLALAVPEARVIALPETDAGCIAHDCAHLLESEVSRADAILIGPGMQDERLACAFTHDVLAMAGDAQFILDASAMGLCTSDDKRESAKLARKEEREPEATQRNFLHRYSARVLLTPHAGEMAHLTGLAKDEVAANPAAIALEAAHRWQATVALKGGCTCIAAPDGRLWLHEGGNIGLAVSGSGDTLAGIIAGLAARGASLEQACIWGVALHARAGQYLAARSGPLGYLIRDLSATVPLLMHQLLSE